MAIFSQPLSHGVAFTKALLQYKELNHHERAEVAEQAADEYKHYALIKDYLRSRGADVEDIPADAYDVYFGHFLTVDVEAFRLCNIAERSAVVFMTHMSRASKDPEVRKLAAAIVGDEEGHEGRIKAKLAEVAEDESRRGFLEKHFVQSWAAQKEGVFLEAKELGLDLEKVLANFHKELDFRGQYTAIDS